MLNYTCNASTYLLMFQLTTICAKSVISSHNNHKITDKQCNPYFHFQLYFSTLNQHCVVPKQFKDKINKHLFAYQLYDTYSPLFRVWVTLR